MEEFTYDSGEEITKLIVGKTVDCIETPNVGPDGHLTIKFTDETSLRIKYDWLYEWELRYGK